MPVHAAPNELLDAGITSMFALPSCNGVFQAEELGDGYVGLA